ncbi:MAG: membrane lipoprotein lipid attachment site-containing protein [Paludibacteraceae bacterium]|nr:membrane lipoprotein lipid attachment site-containing protein [Paludibacteraceae bacterium]
MKRIIYILPLLLAVAGCSAPARPEKKDIGEHSFNKAYVKFYGAHYTSRGIKNNVIDLDLYSEGLGLDSTGHIAGTGTNLYISDIFLPAADSTLTPETYLCDTTGAEYTFLPGVNYDSNISGAYILRITDGTLAAFTVFDDGEFRVEQAGDSMHIVLSMKYMESGIERTYEAEGQVITEKK